MDDAQFTEFRKWYKLVQPRYAGLGVAAQNILKEILDREKIDYLSITSRPKEEDKVIEKCIRKEYQDPKVEMTDYTGVRVVTFIDADTTKVSKVVRDTFHCHEDKSLDKSDELGADRTGYRSIHFVCDLGKVRSRLPEFAIYKGLVFEIQVRSALQHAWAEIEHDRSYKFAGKLRDDLRRRLNLVAGVLEVADREFNSVALELDTYAKEVAEKAEEGKLDIRLDSTSLGEYLRQKLSESERGIIDDIDQPRHTGPALQELEHFAVFTLADLDKLLTRDFLTNSVKYKSKGTVIGFMRSAMMYADLEKYLRLAWNKKWNAVQFDTAELLRSKYGASADAEFAKHKIDLLKK